MKTLIRLMLALALALAAIDPVLADEIVIPGSGNPEFVLGELAKAFNAQQTKHRVSIPPSSGTAGALRAIDDGAATMGRVGRPLTPEERGRGLTYVPLGRDAVVFVAGSAVTATNVTREQMLGVYGGKFSDWRELGGKPGPIRAIGREVTDASRRVLDREIPGFANIQFHEGVKVVHLDPHLIELLDRFPTSLGFLNRSALAAAKTRLEILSLDGVAPSVDNLKAGRYPLWMELGVIYRTDALTEAGRAFLQFIQSPAGSRILENNGVLTQANR